MLACCNAAGYTIPPLVIFDRKTLKPEMTVGEVPGTMYGLSSSGWIDTELFELWFAHHFLAHAPPVRPPPLTARWPFQPLPTLICTQSC